MEQASAGISQVAEGPAVVAEFWLKNYKSHEDTYVVFEGNNVAIRGTNNSGKTNLIKGMQVLLMNEDLPADHVRHGENWCELGCLFTDGRKMRRVRKGAKQTLTLYHANGEEEEFDKVSGADEHVKRFTGFGTVQLDTNDKPFNFHFIPLGAPPFLLGRSADKVYRTLSILLSGQGIETAKVNLGKTIKGLRDELNVKNKTYALNSEMYEALNDPKWASYQNTLTDLKGKQGTVDEMDTTIGFMETYCEQKEKFVIDPDFQLAVTVADEEALPSVREKITALQDMDETLDRLRVMRDDINTALDKAVELESALMVEEEAKAKIDKELANFKCSQCDRIVMVVG